MDLEYLLGALDDDPRLAKYAALNRALVGLVDDYSHVRFQTLSITVRGACNGRGGLLCATPFSNSAGCHWPASLFSGLSSAASVACVCPGNPLTTTGAHLAPLACMYVAILLLGGARRCLAQSQESVGALVKVVDKANGYMFSEMDAAGLMAARVP